MWDASHCTNSSSSSSSSSSNNNNSSSNARPVHHLAEATASRKQSCTPRGPQDSTSPSISGAFRPNPWDRRHDSPSRSLWRTACWNACWSAGNGKAPGRGAFRKKHDKTIKEGGGSERGFGLTSSVGGDD